MSRIRAGFLTGIAEIDRLRFVAFPTRKTALTHAVRVNDIIVAPTKNPAVLYYRAPSQWRGLYAQLPRHALDAITACAKLGIISDAALTALSDKDAKQRARIERHNAAVELREHAKLLGIKLTKRQEFQRDQAEAGR